MTRRYRVLPAADQDLDDQAAYLVAEASLEIALRFYDSANISRAPRPRIGLFESVTASLVGELFGNARVIAEAIEPPLIMGIIHVGDRFATVIANDRGPLVPAILDDAQGHRVSTLPGWNELPMRRSATRKLGASRQVSPPRCFVRRRCNPKRLP